MSVANAERNAILDLLAGVMKARHDAGDFAAVRTLRDFRDLLRRGKHRAPQVRQISTLPPAQQARALEHVQKIREQHQSAGTEPTPIPKGAQR